MKNLAVHMGFIFFYENEPARLVPTISQVGFPVGKGIQGRIFSGYFKDKKSGSFSYGNISIKVGKNNPFHNRRERGRIFPGSC
jgi:hypothetical protein